MNKPISEGVRVLVAELNEYLRGCPDPNKTRPKWMVRKPSRLLWRCRDAILSLIAAREDVQELVEQRVQELLERGYAAHSAVVAALSQQREAKMDEELSHADLCRLSRVFNDHNELHLAQDRHINDWLDKRIASALSQYTEARGGVELSDHVIRAYDGLVRDADTLRATGNPAMAMRVASAAQVLRVAALSQYTEARGVVDELIDKLPTKMLHSQSWSFSYVNGWNDAINLTRQKLTAALTGERNE